MIALQNHPSEEETPEASATAFKIAEEDFAKRMVYRLKSKELQGRESSSSAYHQSQRLIPSILWSKLPEVPISAISSLEKGVDTTLRDKEAFKSHKMASVNLLESMKIRLQGASEKDGSPGPRRVGTEQKVMLPATIMLLLRNDLKPEEGRLVATASPDETPAGEVMARLQRMSISEGQQVLKRARQLADQVPS